MIMIGPSLPRGMLLAAVAGMLNPRRVEMWRGTKVMVGLERLKIVAV